MKRIFLGATAFAALLFSSCGKNDNASTDLTGALGNWNQLQLQDNHKYLVIVIKKLCMFLLRTN